MRKSKLMRKNEDFIRVLAVDGDDIFYFSCQGIKSIMPKWGKASDLEGYMPCDEKELQGLFGIEIVQEESLEPEEKKDARSKYMFPLLFILSESNFSIY